MGLLPSPLSPGRAAIGRSILLLVALTSLRVLAVVGQPPIEEYLFSFAPTALAMRLNNLTGSGCLLLFFLTFLYDPSATPSDPNDPSGSTRSELSASALAVGRSRCVPRLRAEARPWLLFLCISYWGVSLGYTLYAWAGLSPVAAMWIQEGFLYLYAALFAPCLLLTFKREQRYWRAHALAPHSAAALAASYAMAAHGSPQHAERLLGASPSSQSYGSWESATTAAAHRIRVEPLRRREACHHGTQRRRRRAIRRARLGCSPCLTLALSPRSARRRVVHQCRGCPDAADGARGGAHRACG